MALHIKHFDAERLARQLAAKTGETLTDAVLNALRERLSRKEARRRVPLLPRELEAIRKRCSSLSVPDARPTSEIVAYDEHGMPRRR
jgi:antitoxin VapB